MKILGIDPSLSCTGWAILDSDDKTIVAGEIKTLPSMWHEDKLHHIVQELDSLRRRNMSISKLFIEGEAYAGTGHVIQLAELIGAIKETFWYLAPLTYTPTQARKLWFGKGKIPFDKKKESKEYSKWIIKNSCQWLDNITTGNDSLDACVISLAGLTEIYASIPNEELMLMRLHDANYLTKNHKKVYGYGKGKKRVLFKSLKTVSEQLREELTEKYWSILGKRK